MRLGVDTGGTFTDFAWLDGDGRLRIHKQLSTPHEPSQAILAGIEEMGVPKNTAVVHGSTVATNALLERRGARTALITTAGFADVLAIGRQNRPQLYALVPQKPEPLVPREWRFEVNERVSAQGEILTSLDPADLTPILEQIAAEGIESVAVCLLFSFLRPEHERLIEEVIGNWQLVINNDQSPMTNDPLPITKPHVSLSSEILPEYREYERTATTVINAYVAPLMSRYLQRLAEGIAPRPLAVMQSNGGIISARAAGRQAARTVLSGPAGGVVGARFVAGRAGFDDLITFDMGGTSTDVALCPARLPTTAEGEIAGLPLRLPIIDIHTVGAGGGSLARLDVGGALQVGPQSAGADPGPACYPGSPNRQATTTDAHLVLGRLDADHFLGGAMRLDAERAREALAELGRAMGGVLPESAAWGVVQVANMTMERAIRRISVERGYDPRYFALVAFGGAGPLHACDLAASLHIPRVLIPPAPGILSALGMLVAAPTKDYSQTVMLQLGANGWRAGDGDSLAVALTELWRRAQVDMAAEGYAPKTLTLRASLDMRYLGQSHELNVSLPADYQSLITNPQLPVTDLFHQAHEQRYGYRQPGATIEMVTARLAAVAPVVLPELPAQEMGTNQAERAVVGRQPVWFSPVTPTDSLLYERAKLRPGDEFQGPAVVFQYDTTTVVPPDWTARVDGYENLLVVKRET
ncbi:MAG: hydantoinase/oxoprolinase family protein [Chloroflexota bacterium]